MTRQMTLRYLEAEEADESGNGLIFSVFDRLRAYWHLVTGGLLLALIATGILLRPLSPEATQFALVFLIAFTAAFLAGSLGLGFGAVLVPALILLGHSPALAVQSSLILQAFVIPVGGLSHLKQGNVRTGIFVPLVALGIVGTVVGALVSVRLAESLHTALIGGTTLVMGLLVLRKRLTPYEVDGGEENAGGKRIMLIAGIGALAGFASGALGTGWGPIGVSLLILAGILPRFAIGSSVLSRALIALSGSATYFILRGIQVETFLPLVIGGLVAVVPGTLTTRKLEQRLLKKTVGLATIILGVLTFLKV